MPKMQTSMDFLDLNFVSGDFNYVVCTKESLDKKPFGGVRDINFYLFNSDIEVLSAQINYKYVVGESVTVPHRFSEDFLKKSNIAIVKKESHEGNLLYYCYLKDLSKKLVSGNFIFNLQIAVYENSFKVGYPAIIDGF